MSTVTQERLFPEREDEVQLPVLTLDEDVLLQGSNAEVGFRFGSDQGEIFRVWSIGARSCYLDIIVHRNGSHDSFVVGFTPEEVGRLMHEFDYDEALQRLAMFAVNFGGDRLVDDTASNLNSPFFIRDSLTTNH